MRIRPDPKNKPVFLQPVFSRFGDIRLQVVRSLRSSQPPDSRTYSTEVTTVKRCNLPLHRIMLPAFHTGAPIEYQTPPFLSSGERRFFWIFSRIFFDFFSVLPESRIPALSRPETSAGPAGCRGVASRPPLCRLRLHLSPPGRVFRARRPAAVPCRKNRAPVKVVKN